MALHEHPTPTQEGDYISGYLLKKSSKGEWNKQFFELSGDYLVSYKNAKMTKMSQAVGVAAIAAIHFDNDQNKKASLTTFQIDLKDKQIILRAQTEEEAKNWVRVLQSIRERSSVSSSLNPLNSNDTRSFSMSQTPNILYMNAVGRESSMNGRRSSGTSIYSRSSGGSVSTTTSTSRHNSMGSNSLHAALVVRGNSNSNSLNNGSSSSSSSGSSSSSSSSSSSIIDQKTKTRVTDTIMEEDEHSSKKLNEGIDVAPSKNSEGDVESKSTIKDSEGDVKDTKSGCCCTIS